MKVSEIICKLKKLDLSNYPYFEIRELIREFQKMGFLVFTLHQGKEISRARPEANLKTVSDLSYKPQKCNNSCQRASTPNSTMFYGCIVSGKQTLDATRFISACECSKLLRDGLETSGKEAITYGRWEVLEDIHLLTIVHKSCFESADNSLLCELKTVYEEYLTQTPEIENELNTIAEYFAQEFSKDNSSGNDYNYLVSAVFTEVAITDYGYDGVMYPSVQAGGGFGFNVAIAPHAVDSKMKLTLAYETTLFKNGEKARIVGERVGKIQDDKMINYSVYKDYDEREVAEYLNINDLNELEQAIPQPPNLLSPTLP